jgi:dolichyl-phosphate beta-glucosyltransferase
VGVDAVNRDVPGPIVSPLETDVTVIVPAYNEVRRIAATIDEIRTYFRSAGLTCQIIVSADGDDGTRERAAAESRPDDPIVVVGSAARGGKGRGIRSAVPLATGRIIGFVDADQKTPLSEYDKVRPAFESGADVVIGSRGLRGSEIENPQPWYRQMGSRGFALFMHTVVGLGSIPDTQCGFKFFRADVARSLFARQRIDGYMFDVEILYLAERLRYRIEQVPVRWRDDGDSRLNLMAGNLKNVQDIFRIRFAQGIAPGSGTEVASWDRTEH